MLVFQEGRKPENPEKNIQGKAKKNSTFRRPHITPGRNGTWLTLMDYTIPAPSAAPFKTCAPLNKYNKTVDAYNSSGMGGI